MGGYDGGLHYLCGEEPRMTQFDRTTKLLLASIALALWIIALKPVGSGGIVSPAYAQINELNGIASDVSSIRSDLSGVASGLCLNSKLC